MEYKTEKYTLYNDDCITVLDNMIQNGDTVDMIFTDPPYRVTSRGNAGNSGGMLQKKINKAGQVFEHNNIEIEVYLPKFYKVLKETGHCYIMTNHVNLQEILNTATECGFHFIKSLIWDKGNKIMGQCYMSQFEYILFFRKGKHKKINNCGTSDILSIPNKKTKDENGKNLHDVEKPVNLMKVLVENSSNKGDLVLDPFMGIGATGIACVKSDRNFIGIEIDENYFNIAKERIEDNIK